MIRTATVRDVPVILDLVRALAAYEREPDAVQATEEMLTTALFGPAPVASCHVAEDSSGLVVGFALWYVTFSTWTGRPGLWLEDLFVLPAARGAGHGRDLLQALAQVCVDRGYPRLEWWVLDWNTSAQEFYGRLGARAEDEWTVWRMEPEAIAALAEA
ncbi:MAG TPA: GNAT family N-acetyltransferase [Mycobacteriales bacterium]|nr:GNAT family N-acetyltransferase [Mycobacteriales bacterium]